MIKNFKNLLLVLSAICVTNAVSSQNVSLNMLVLNSGVVPLGGTATLQATVNATTGTAGQNNAVAAGKVNVQITVPPSLTISTVQSNIASGWIIRNNDGTVINLCNSGTTIPVNTAVNLLIELQGNTATTGSPTLSGQISFRTNCSAPGSLAGDNTSDNSSQAGFSVSGTVPVQLSTFTAEVTSCQPTLKWTTESEIQTRHFEIQRSNAAYINWTTINILAARGSQGVRTMYEYTDRNAANIKWLYRLKQTDYDGKFTYSATLPVTINCSGNQLSTFPNPVYHGTLYVSITGQDKETEASLFTTSGQLMKKIQLRNGTNQINVSSLSSGIYILQSFAKDGTRLQSKVLIQ